MTIVVPHRASRAFTMLLLSGYSINILTMFGMVLAIGVMVDVAVVHPVGNVEAHRRARRASAGESTKKRVGPDIRRHHRCHAGDDRRVRADGVLPRLGGHHPPSSSRSPWSPRSRSPHCWRYRRRPALCATFLQADQGRTPPFQEGVFGWFNRKLDATRDGFSRTVGWSIRRTGRLLIVHVALLVGTDLGLRLRMPGGFLPIDDQGFITADVQTPSGLLVRSPPKAPSRRLRSISEEAFRYRERCVPHRLWLPRAGP